MCKILVSNLLFQRFELSAGSVININIYLILVIGFTLFDEIYSVFLISILKNNEFILRQGRSDVF